MHNLDSTFIWIHFTASMDITFYEVNMKTCLRALARGEIPSKSELLHKGDASVEPGTPQS